MDEKPIESTPSTTTEPTGPPPKKRSGVKSLVLLLACCGAFFWAYKTIREEMKPNADIARLIRSSDVMDRVGAVRRLADVETEYLPTAIAMLITTQSDSSEAVRSATAWALGAEVVSAMRAEENAPFSRQAAQALTRSLADDNGEVRSTAADGFSQIAKITTAETFPAEIPPVVSALVGLLSDPNENARKSGRLALGSFASTLAISPPPALVELVSKGKTAGTRAEAALALGLFKTGVEATVQTLTAALKDSEAEVRSAAAVSLRRFGLEAAPALPALIVVLDDPYEPPTAPSPPLTPGAPPIRSANGGQAGQPPAIDPAAEAARTIGPIVEAQVARGQAPSAEIITALFKSLKSGRPAIKDAATEFFQRVRKGASSVVPELVSSLNESIPNAEPGFGPVAAATLGEVGPGSPTAGEAIAGLIAALDAKAVATRSNAVVALGRFGPAAVAAIPRLKEIAEADKDMVVPVKTATDRIEGKIPPDAPRRKGGGGGRRGGGGPPAKKAE